MTTEKLFYENAYTRTFTGRILSCEAAKSGWQVILDRTAFFPEGGGQTADTGVLGGVRVLDVHEKDGAVIHLTGAPLPVGETVEGEIDWAERFRKMQNHTGEHIVSGIVHARFDYENVGFHLAECGCTFDFDGELTRQELDEIEQAANAAVWDNRAVTTSFPSPAELDALTYRSKLELRENVRIVTINGIDRCACCAPHVSRTGEVGIIKLLDFMRHRGGVRIWAKCGWDALMDYRSRYTASAAISGLLNTPQADIVPGVEKLLAQRDEAQKALRDFRLKALEAQAAALTETEGNMLLFAEDADEAGLRLLANAGMEKCGGICAVFTGTDGDFRFVMASLHHDMRIFAKEIREPLTARGGGQERMISGRCAAGSEKLRAYFGV